MTTSVRVINDGPGDVVVSVITPETSDIVKSVVLKPGQVTPAHDPLYLHSGAVLGITEVPRNG